MSLSLLFSNLHPYRGAFKLIIELSGRIDKISLVEVRPNIDSLVQALSGLNQNTRLSQLCKITQLVLALSDSYVECWVRSGFLHILYTHLSNQLSIKRLGEKVSKPIWYHKTYYGCNLRFP